ncbi:MAG: hypothetical protein JST26_04805 [Bacteroidetes bacterium]|nr:hypothetical protein [Bacteroidota bacterium]
MKTSIKIGLVIIGALNFSLKAQIETPIQVVEDTVIRAAKPNGNGITWNFTGINFSNYPAVNDSDLVELQDPEAVYDNANFQNLGDSVVDNLPSRQYVNDFFTMSRQGKYIAQYAGNGTLNIPGLSYTNVDKIKIVETYYLMSSPDTISSYTNSYYAFFKKTDKTYLFSTFSKKRTLKGFLGTTVYGINFNAITSNGQASVFNNANLQMVLNPNPATGQTTFSYNLVAGANVIIQLTNQASTINTTVFSGNKASGQYQQIIPLTGLQAGLYNVRLIVNGIAFSTSLIIQ